MRQHIVFEHFREGSDRPRKSRLFDILSSGRVKTCVQCGAFTQTSKKRSRVRPKEGKRKPWDGKCHRCGSALADLSRFVRVAKVPSYWLFVTIRKDSDACDHTADESFFLQWPFAINPRVKENHAAIYAAISVHIGRPVRKNNDYCLRCGETLFSWNVQTKGLLFDLIRQGSFLVEWLTAGKYKVVTFEDRAKAEGIPLETLMAPPSEQPEAKNPNLGQLVVDDLVVDQFRINYDRVVHPMQEPRFVRRGR